MPMVTYPLNNIEYTAEDAELFHSTRTSGVYAVDSFDYFVSGADNTIVIGTGIAWIKNSEFSGKVVAQKEPVSIDAGLPDPNYERIDAIAIQFDANKNASEIVVKNGVPSSNPVAPSVVRTESIYELHLYHVRRSAGSLTISANNITDLRSDNNYCGIMTDSVTQAVDTTLSKHGVAADAAAVGIALNGKAPAGFGLGGNAESVTSADNISANGYYETAITVGGHVESCIIWHNQHSANYAEQFAVSIIGSAVGSILHRVKTGGTWQPWEWVNPPMTVGVEYRTTERWRGKPVYTKLLSLGNLPNATEKIVYHNIENLDQPLSATIGAKSADWSFALPAVDSNITRAVFNRQHVEFKCTSNWVGYTAYATLKYSKN